MEAPNSILHIAVEGCCHGELDLIYQNLFYHQQKNQILIDVLLICGDFQCVTDKFDLECLAVPFKYRKLNNFHQYASGEKIAPILTIFIGGNHEASNILQNLYYGGWVAHNIYFLGFAGSVIYKGIRISGLSGIFNNKHYNRCHFEIFPYSEDTKRSVYHLRELEVFKMSHLKNSQSTLSNIFLSHDWPSGIWEHGNKAWLLKKKPYFKNDMISGELGSRPLRYILNLLKPNYWFAAHLHVKFMATVNHFNESTMNTMQVEEGESITCSSVDPMIQSNNKISGKRKNSHQSPSSLNQKTTFLALDKAVPGRDFLHVFSLPSSQLPPLTHSNNSKATATAPSELQFDAEWLAIVRRTHYLLEGNGKMNHAMDALDICGCHRSDANHLSNRVCKLPNAVDDISVEEIQYVQQRLMRCYEIDDQLFIPAASNYAPLQTTGLDLSSKIGNIQTDVMLHALQLPHIWTKPSGMVSINCPCCGQPFNESIPRVSVGQEKASESDGIAIADEKTAVIQQREVVVDPDEMEI